MNENLVFFGDISKRQQRFSLYHSAKNFKSIKGGFGPGAHGLVKFKHHHILFQDIHSILDKSRPHKSVQKVLISVLPSPDEGWGFPFDYKFESAELVLKPSLFAC